MSLEVQTAVYIDYDNLYRSMNESYSAYSGAETVKSIVKYLRTELNCDVKLVKAFCDFKNSSNEIDDLQQNLVELRHINSVGNGKGNASDIGLAIDVIKSLYNSKEFGKYVIISSDSDMLPLILELCYQGKKVDLIYLKSKINDRYSNILNENPNIDIYNIEEILGIDVYTPLTKEMVINDQSKLVEYLNFINFEMNEIFNLYNINGTIGQKKLKEKLSKKFSIEDQDASCIIDCLKEIGYLEVVTKEITLRSGEVQERNVCILNESNIQGDNISLDDKVLLVY